jgi:hypothetical protein
MTEREAKQWAAAKRRCYLGLLLGVAVGLVLFAIAFWSG